MPVNNLGSYVRLTVRLSTCSLAMVVGESGHEVDYHRVDNMRTCVDRAGGGRSDPRAGYRLWRHRRRPHGLRRVCRIRLRVELRRQGRSDRSYIERLPRRRWHELRGAPMVPERLRCPRIRSVRQQPSKKLGRAGRSKAPQDRERRGVPMVVTCLQHATIRPIPPRLRAGTA